MTTCPICKGRQFMVNADPGGGSWFCCNTCRFAGDTIQLVAHTQSLDIRQAVEKLRRQDTTGSFRQQTVDEYFHWIERRKALDEYWNSCSDKSFIHKTATDTGRAMLDFFKVIKPLQAEDWSEGLGQFVGLTTAGFYQTTLKPTDIANRMPGNAGKSYLVSPLFDAPGRIATLGIFDIYNGNKRFGLVKPPCGNADALMFMNGLHLYEEVLYATSDLVWALALQTWAFLSSQGPVPVVGYTPDTKLAWANLRPKKIIFWDALVSPDTFLAARQVPERAFIAKNPRVEQTADPFAKLADSSTRVLLNTMQVEAEPWLKALKDYLIGLDYSSVQDVVTRLDLAPAHRQEMLSYCSTKEEREKIANLVDTGLIQMSIPMGAKGRFLVQKSDGWYIQYKSEAECHLVSEAMPVIETFTNFKTKVIYAGHIRIRGKSIPFEVERDNFTTDWLKQHCQEHDEIIEVHDSIEKNFNHYVLQFHTPDKLEGLDCIGWDDRDKAFAFPGCTLVSNGDFRDMRRPTPKPHPTQQLFSPTTFVLAHLRGWLDDTAARATYWALMAGAVANMLAPAVGAKTFGVGLTDDSQIGLDVFDRAVTDSFCETWKYAGKDSEALQHLLKAEKQHHMPLAVTTNLSPLLFRWINSDGDRNALAILSKNMLQPVTLRGGWVLVKPPSLALESSVLTGSCNILPAVLAYFQKTDRKLPRADHIVKSVLKLLHAWLGQEFQIESPAVLRAAEKIIDVGPGDDSEGLVRRFIGTVMCLVDEGVLPVAMTNDLIIQPNTKAAITLSDTGVFINYAVIAKALQSHKLHTPSDSQLTQAFRDIGMLQEDVVGLSAFLGWRLDRAKWAEYTIAK